MTAELYRLDTEEPGLSADTSVPDRLLRLPAVAAMIGLSRSEIYRRIEAGRFPLPVQIGTHSVAWRQSDVLRWMAELPQQQRPERKRLPLRSQSATPRPPRKPKRRA